MSNTIRLPQHIKPLRYKITLKPNLESFTFEGEETIKLEIARPTKQIVLHSKELIITDVQYKISNFQFLISEQIIKPKFETITFEFKNKLPKGRGELHLKFKGVLNDKMRGFYRSRYQHKGRQKHLAVSQFEATDARRAFPCFDEPAKKAVFEVSLIVPKHHTAISNTIETSVQEHQAGYKVVNFAPSPKMSTYLLALISGEFESLQGKTKDGILVRVFTTPGKKHQAKFALTTAIKTLEFYNSYFDIPYPLPVLDLIAIPDFSHGAMENWGAVTYRESALLVDEEHSSSANKQWAALVIAHELAHQWFGNLVTMEWWTHLWLNEGFASYIEYLAVNHVFPHWDIWTQFAYNDLGVALKLDSLKNTHPIEIEVHHPDEIGEIFDEVSYSKGASIIRMLADYLGEKSFRNGLRYYLKKHSYSNASTIHLWQAFEKVSKKPVAKIMRNWTSKPGFPVIRVIEREKQLLLKQTRFFSSPISKKQARDKTIWSIPVRVEGSGLRVQGFLFKQKQMLIKKLRSEWVKINPGETGFYRVDYPAQMLGALQKPIKSKALPALDRLGIIRDAFALAEAGELPTIEALELAKNYAGEDNYTVWIELAFGLDTIANLIFGQNYYRTYYNYCRKIFSPLAKKLGWRKIKGESHSQGLLRSLALYHAGTYGDVDIIKRAKKLFRLKNVSPDTRSIVYQLSAENGGETEHKKLIARYKREPLQEERGRLGRALGHFKQQKLLLKTLNFAVSKHARYQDTAGIVAAVWNNPRGKNLAWQFIKKHWALLLERYPSSGHMLSRFLKPAANFTSERQADDFQKFFNYRPAPGAKRAIQQVLEKIRSNSAWLKRDGKHLANWLKNQN